MWIIPFQYVNTEELNFEREVRLTLEEFKAFRHEAVHELKDLNDQCSRVYRISNWGRWDYNLDDRILVFSDSGVPKVIASVQVVGTTSAARKNWLWGWANGYMPSPIVARIEEVRRFGVAEGIPELTEP